MIADNSGKWVGNALRFATEQEAKDYVWGLSMRWMMVRETRVVESEDAVSYVWTENGARSVEEMAMQGKGQ